MRASLDDVLAAVARVSHRPGSAALLQALRAATDAQGGALVASLRAAMAPAAVLATQDEDAIGVLDALGEAYNDALAAIEEPRLALAPPPRLVDALTTVARGEPRTVGLARKPFTPPPPEAPAPEAVVAPATEGDEAPDDAGLEKTTRRAREDWRVTEGVRPDPPAVTLLEPRPSHDVAAWYATISAQALDRIAARARDRTHDLFSARIEAEEGILTATDAVLAAGDDPVASIVRWWRRAADSSLPWSTWAAVFALGSIEGADALLALRHGLLSLPPNAVAHGEQAAEALAVSRHPDRATLAAELVASPHPIARSVGVDLLARAGALNADGLRPHILDPNVPVAVAALRALARLRAEEGAKVARLLERWIHFPDRTVAWHAARTLLRWGNLTPCADVRGGGRLASILGPRALEVLILAGTREDQALVSTMAARAPRTPALLSALARFGHPGVWAFLIHQLDNEDLAEPAAGALATLFGACVDDEARRHGPAWKEAVRRLAPSPEVRYRRGEPWRPGVVATECSAGDLSRAEIEPRLDELGTRAHVEKAVDLAHWTFEARPGLGVFCAAATNQDAAWPRDGW